MFQKLIPATVLALLACETLLAATSYVASAYFLSPVDPMIWLIYEDGLWRIGLMVAGVLFGMYLQDLYQSFRATSYFLLLQQVMLVLGVAFLFQAFLAYVSPALVIPRWTMMVGTLTLLAVLPLWRMVYSSAVGGLATDRLLFVGASPIARMIDARIRAKPELGLSSIGYVTNSAEAEQGLAPVLGPLSRLREIVREVKPSRVVVGMAERRKQMPVEDLLELSFAGVEVEDASQLFETVFGRVSLQRLDPSQFIFTRMLGPHPTTVRIQAAYGFITAVVLVVVTLPLMLLVAAAVRLSSRGPALFRQQRVGRYGEVFTLYKFRSMRDDAEAATGAVWAAPGDPRITGLGHWLRRLRLDELPQLFNVLKGDMTLVGPRPERPEFVEVLSERIPFYKHRLCIKPGITGWAQINHKYGDSFDDTVSKLEYDLYYIKNLSPGFDFYIIFHTLKVMLLSRGAQ